MNIGPNITKDGLVLYYDAANTKSFRGEPTTNYDILTNSNYTGQANNYGSYCTITNGNYYGKDCYKIILNIPSGTVFSSWKGAYFIMSSTSLATKGFVNGDWVTRSFDVYIESIKNPSYLTVSIEGTSSNKSYENINYNIIGKWQRVSCTSQIVDITQSNNYLLYVASHNAGTTTTDLSFVIYVCNVQTEKKSYDTHYVPTSRGNTIATGGGIIDISINDNNSTNFSNVLYNKNNNGVFNFTGSGTALNTGNLDLSYTKSVSVSFWFKTTQSINTVIMEMTENSTGLDAFLVEHNYPSSGNIMFSITDSGGQNSIYTNGSYNDNKWHHFVGIINRTLLVNPQLNIYIDNILDYTQRTTSIKIINTFFVNRPLYIGSRGNSNYFYNGSLSQIMIYDRVLSPTEVDTIYNNQKSRYI